MSKEKTNGKTSLENDVKEPHTQKAKVDSDKKELTPEEKQERKKKLIRKSVIAFVLIGVAIGVSFLGPANMEPGQYQVRLTFSDYNDVIFDINMADSADTTTIEIFRSLSVSGNSCIIFTDQTYKSSTHSKVEYRVGILDNANNSIQNLELNLISSNINGAGIDRKVRPTKIETIHSTELGKNIDVIYFSMAVPFKAGVAIGLLVIIAGLWISEIVPTIVGAFLVPIVVVISGISSTGEALQPFFDPVIALFFGGFIIAEALKKHNIDRRLALGIIGNAKFRPSTLILILMIVSAFLSMWMSNTASAAVMIPIAIALVTQIESGGKEKNLSGFRKALILGIGYAATTGGIASIIGTPANPIAISGLADVGVEISFLKWIGFGLPFVLIMLFIIWGYLLLVFKPKISKESLSEAQIVFRDDLKKMGKMNKKQWITVAIFIFTIVLWLMATPLKNWTNGVIAISSGIVALIAVVLIFGFNLLEVKDVKNVNWNALFLFGGGLSLGDALVATGIGDWIASKMGIIEGKHFIVIALIVGGISLLVTAVASNTASAAMLIPLVIPIAISLQIDPTLLALMVAMGSSIDYALVFGTPPTMISYSTGYFSVKEIFRVGSILDIVGIIVLSTVSVFLWIGFGLIWI
ncbi:MAG: DASS family sodium-coupled anion symporter [Candidatus Heimdallarchaeota archaeon]|nr:DASS family sodium-coupled anion symporter [Candidatus Heimdallarchaeota archaeon]MCK5185073.1 DASS family sodium-coupled anion symporter [Candidatus Heimdallarchaeota archaeon]